VYKKTGEPLMEGGEWKYRVKGLRGKTTDYPTKQLASHINILVPYSDSEIIDGRLVLRGVFTNNPAITRAQVASGMAIEVPEGFKKRNPSIEIQGTYVVGTYMPGDFDNELLVERGMSVPLAAYAANRAGVSRKSRTTEAAQFLFVENFADPSRNAYYGRQAQKLYENVKNKLVSNLYADGRDKNRSLPFSYRLRIGG
jgi:hypothetical protein